MKINLYALSTQNVFDSDRFLTSYSGKSSRYIVIKEKLTLINLIQQLINNLFGTEYRKISKILNSRDGQKALCNPEVRTTLFFQNLSELNIKIAKINQCSLFGKISPIRLPTREEEAKKTLIDTLLKCFEDSSNTYWLYPEEEDLLADILQTTKNIKNLHLKLNPKKISLINLKREHILNLKEFLKSENLQNEKILLQDAGDEVQIVEISGKKIPYVNEAKRALGNTVNRCFWDFGDGLFYSDINDPEKPLSDILRITKNLDAFHAYVQAEKINYWFDCKNKLEETFRREDFRPEMIKVNMTGSDVSEISEICGESV